MIRITDSIALDEAEIDERFIRAAGPGGQNVNKTSSAVQLRFDARHSPNLPTAVYGRLKALAGRRMTAAGEIIITAREFRTQEQNRRAALERLVDLIRQAARPPKYRRPTKPTKGSKERRLEGKKLRTSVKRTRGAVRFDD